VHTAFRARGNVGWYVGGIFAAPDAAKLGNDIRRVRKTEKWKCFLLAKTHFAELLDIS